MDKVNVVLAVFDRKFLESAIQRLNFDGVNLTAILIDGVEKFIKVGEKQIPRISFADFYLQVKNYKNFIWLVDGISDGAENFHKTKKFLMTFGIDEKNIVNFSAAEKISPVWLANFWHVKENGADFFATGSEFTCDNLNLKFIAQEGGVNLAEKNQTLSQSYLIAKNIFESTPPKKIKFVLIGLSPELFFTNEEENFDFQYLPMLSNVAPEKVDLNFDGTRKNLAFSSKSVIDWDDSEKTFSEKSAEKNTQILKNYIKLCQENNAKAVGVVFPVAPAVRKTYDKKTLENFRRIIQELEESKNFIFVDMFENNLNYDCFCGMKKLNLKGQKPANAFISMKLFLNDCISIDGFCKMTYEYLNNLTWLAGKEDYNLLTEKIFSNAAEKIRRKEKIKLAFVTRNAAEWCGDDLYNLFAQDPHFEVTILDCLEINKVDNVVLAKDFWNGVEKFKKSGLNVVALDNKNTAVPRQDIFIFLTPYFGILPAALRPTNLKLNTLLTHIPYSFSISIRVKSFYNSPMFNIAWKMFISSKISLDVYSSNSKIGLPSGVFSGYPRMDIFFKRNPNFHFDWKMARPDAKKIIYAPHWSIDAVTRYATFQWNYKFMYEFAKNHPEISWVIKPHPTLFSYVVEVKLFPSAEAFAEYLQMWDDLPNAQVYTGAYYQGLFATSDGMIHDSGSFIAEYQFVNKPMIFLTREGEKFNKLGQEILKASYLVDGKDFEKISETMQKVFIEGKDDKAPIRRDVYMKYLNYPGYTGMLASTFIYKSIADELKGD